MPMLSCPGLVRRYADTEMFDIRDTSLRWGISISRVGGRVRDLEYAQLCFEVPLRLGKVPAHRVYQNFVLVELQDNVGKPPGSLALNAIAVAG